MVWLLVFAMAWLGCWGMDRDEGDEGLEYSSESETEDASTFGVPPVPPPAIPPPAVPPPVVAPLAGPPPTVSPPGEKPVWPGLRKCATCKQWAYLRKNKCANHRCPAWYGNDDAPGWWNQKGKAAGKTWDKSQ